MGVSRATPGRPSELPRDLQQRLQALLEPPVVAPVAVAAPRGPTAYRVVSNAAEGSSEAEPVPRDSGERAVADWGQSLAAGSPRNDREPTDAADREAALARMGQVNEAMREAGLMQPASSHDQDQALRRVPYGGKEMAVTFMKATVDASTLVAGVGCLYNLLRVAVSADEHQDGGGDAIRAGLIAALAVLSAFSVLDCVHTSKLLLDGSPDAQRPGLVAKLMQRMGVAPDHAADLEVIIHPVVSGLIVAVVVLTQHLYKGGDLAARMLYPAAAGLGALMRGTLIVMRGEAAPELRRQGATVELVPDQALLRNPAGGAVVEEV